ncbi:serine/threonine-protein kinase [Nocardioides ultimimeridianus]
MTSPPGFPVAGARIGRFLLLEQIGLGGMGIVFRAREENLGRDVALKVIAPLYAHDPEFRERFTREAQAQASLESAHVVAVYAHGEEDGYLYLASQLIPDGDLGALINRAGVPPLADALDVIEQTASGLYDAHNAGLVHRDIKPGNVLVRLRDHGVRAYLCDFGIARRMNAAATRLSRSGVGTPNYMAPELHAGAPAGVATDIYSLGCVLWAAATGTTPYAGDTEYQIINGHLHEPPPQLPGADAMTQATNRILRIALAKAPAARYASAAAMRDDLQAALRMPAPRTAPIRTMLRGADVPPPTPTPTPAPPQPPPPARPVAAPSTLPGPASSRPRRRLWWALAGLGAVVAVGGGTAAALLTGSDPAPPTDGFADQAPRAIVIASDKEMSVLNSARVTGDVATSKYGKLRVDMIATGDGDCTGSMTQQDGGSAQIIAVGTDFYLKPNAKFLEGDDPGSADALLRLVGDKWLLMNSLRGTFDDVCDLDKLLERDGRENATDTNEGIVRINGEDAVKVREEDNSSTAWDIVYVRVAEPHYMVRTTDDQNDTFTFSEFDQESAITAPRKGEFIDLDKLLRRLHNGG